MQCFGFSLGRCFFRGSIYLCYPKAAKLFYELHGRSRRLFDSRKSEFALKVCKKGFVSCFYMLRNTFFNCFQSIAEHYYQIFHVWLHHENYSFLGKVLEFLVPRKASFNYFWVFSIHLNVYEIVLVFVLDFHSDFPRWNNPFHIFL